MWSHLVELARVRFNSIPVENSSRGGDYENKTIIHSNEVMLKTGLLYFVRFVREPYDDTFVERIKIRNILFRFERTNNDQIDRRTTRGNHRSSGNRNRVRKLFSITSNFPESRNIFTLYLSS